MSEEQNRFSLRKLSVGLASVLVGVSIFGTSQTVKADTVADQNTSAVTSNAQSSDTQENKNAVKSSFSNDNQANNAKSNLIQTQENNLQQIKSNNVQQNPTSSQEVNDSNDLGAEKDIVRTSSLQESNNQSNQATETTVQHDTLESGQKVQSFNLPKNSKLLDNKELATNLTETSNNDWTDPAKHGFHKTNAGWTKHNVGDGVFNAIADQSNFHFEGGYGTTSYNADHQSSGTVDNFGGRASVYFNDVLINKKDITKGNKILIGATPVLTNDSSRYIDFFDDSGSENTTIKDQYGDAIGNISVYRSAANADEWDYLFTITSSKPIASDLKFSFKINGFSDVNFSNTNHMLGTPWFNPYGSLKGTSDANPYKFAIMDSADNKYVTTVTVDAKKGSAQDKWNKIGVANTDNMWMESSLRWDYVALKPFNIGISPQDKSLVKVLRLHSNIPNSPINVKNAGYQYNINFINSDGKANNSFNMYDSAYGDLSNIWAKDDLSAQNLVDTAKDHAVTFSKQSNGDWLICMKLHSDDFKIDPSLIDKIGKKTYLYNISDGDQQYKDSIIKSTKDFYAKNNNLALNPFTVYIYLNDNKTQRLSDTITDVTPNDSYPVGTISETYYPNGDHDGSGLDLSFYRDYQVQYKDELTGKIINTGVIPSQTSAKVDYQIALTDNYQLSPDLTINFHGQKLTPDSNGILHFTVPKDEKATPDPIVINVLGKEDYERDRTYKVVLQKPDHKGGTIDSTYATYNLKMHRDVTGRDSNGKVTFGNWQYTDGNGNTYTYDPSSNKWNSSTGSTNDMILGSAKSAPKDSDFAVDGYTAKSDIAIDGIDLAHFLDGLLAKNSKDKLEITNNGQLILHTADYANPDKLLADGTTYFIKYIVNPQSMTYKFIDDDNNRSQVGSDVNLNGVTDQTINTNLSIPTNYVLANGQTLPTTYTFSATNTPVEIHLTHEHFNITDPAQIQSTAKRTIVFHMPDNLTQTVVQTIGLKRTGYLDKINNKATYTDWTVDDANTNVTVNGVKNTAMSACKMNGKQIMFSGFPIPHINGYKAKVTRSTNKINPAVALFTVSFVAVPTENKPSTPVEATPSKPSVPTDNTNNSAWTNLDHKVVDALNQSDSGWTMPENNSTYTVEVPADDATIDLSDLVIAQPVHAQTRTQIRVNKRFKLSKKHVAKHLKHRKKAVRTFRKYRL